VRFASIFEDRTAAGKRTNQDDISTGGERGGDGVHSVVTVRKPILAVLTFAVGALAIVLFLLYGPGPNGAKASSHSEAPLISQDPRADNTDLYAFVSPDDTSKVTMIANYIPLEAPASGPNFYSFDDSVLYEVKIDNNGDGQEDIGYQFRFTTKTVDPGTFLYNKLPITLNPPGSSDTYANWNRPQTYSVTLVHFNKDGKVIGNPDHPGKGPNDPVILGDNLPTPPDNIGPRSTPNYDALAAAAVTNLPGGIKVFAGQRDDPFFVDLGSIFDLAGLRPFNPFHLIPITPASSGVDALKNYNTHSIAIQVPINQLVDIPNSTIGIYASSSRQKDTVLRDDGMKDGHGPWVQVSRLGNPLINEVVIPLGKKDYWNREDPAGDSQFESNYLKPEVSALENLLYGTGHTNGVLAPIADGTTPDTLRTDLDLILLTGVPGLNFTGSTQSDLLRLNTDIKPHTNGACYHPLTGLPDTTPPSRFGVLAGDLCGYPNGRRLADDVIDIDLRVFAQGYGSFLNTAFGLPNLSPNNGLGDGVDTNDMSFSGTFPYVASPHQGYQVP
jgi:hypothetical protein